MITAISTNEALKTRQHRPLSGGGMVWQTRFIEPPFPQTDQEAGFPWPQAHTAEQDPGAISAAHFHDEDQFQIILAGSGTIGRHAVKPLMVQYTNRQTAYGPIVSSDEGVTYFTLRQIATKGTWYLRDGTDANDKKAPKRNITTPAVEPASGETLRALANADTREIIAPQEDGLAAWLIRVPPNQAFTPNRHPNGTGRYLIVIGGSMVLGGKEYPQRSPVFVSHDEADFHAAAGAGGLELMVLQYPGGERVLSRKVKPISNQGPAAHGTEGHK